MDGRSSTRSTNRVEDDATQVIDIPGDAGEQGDNRDPILSILGIFSSGESNDVAEDKYRYLAEAYLREWHE